ncbi:voltage gated chloride channel domain-containing protein [Moniliophthora roreri MCA 2997]|uniref:Voltage gated chloride channel domain-containing protein n=1 Tax=Moniliophthora roreri (strain MCA 2997) TaxID=1381753 RepID=V2XBK3_MONRO|nr:voltage gated chloride channel domain-containing protein [Moniliophthora roreri MCA 2997]
MTLDVLIYTSTAVISTFATGIHGILKGKPNYGVLSVSAAVNSGISAATFFSIREYIAIPILHGQETVSNTDPKGTQESWTGVRTDKLIASGLSGFATGGIVRTLTAGPRTALSGATAASVICTTLQYIVNELKVVRLQYLAEKAKHHERLGIQPSPSPPEPWTKSILKFIGITPLSNEEYLKKLRLQRDIHLKRIVELETQLEKEREEQASRDADS